MDLLELKARLERADYEVDPHAVAEAIVRRIVAGRAARVAVEAPAGQAAGLALAPAS